MKHSFMRQLMRLGVMTLDFVVSNYYLANPLMKGFTRESMVDIKGNEIEAYSIWNLKQWTPNPMILLEKKLVKGFP